MRKKIITILGLALLMASLSLVAGCGGSDSSTSSGSSTSGTVSGSAN
jgi:hypothetical protein